jgi:tRNA/tmRNA/rRNA uracil-C5-methylase (TrmA/RlmC/RlmD family)
VPAGRCLLAPDEIRTAAEALQARLSRRPQSADRLKAIEIRRSAASRAVLLSCRTVCRTGEQAADFFRLLGDVPNLTGIVVRGLHGRRWVRGRDWLLDRLAGLAVRIGERSFMQANWLLNETLVNAIAEWAGPSPGLRILELYAGIGSLGLLLAQRGALVTQVEGNPSAAADARYAADVNRIDRCRVRSQSVEAMLQNVQQGEYDLVIADPPRTGMSRPCLQALTRLGIPRILYLSCDVPTLARDLEALCASYRIVRLQAFDMFPQTANLETLVELSR